MWVKENKQKKKKNEEQIIFTIKIFSIGKEDKIFFNWEGRQCIHANICDKLCQSTTNCGQLNAVMVVSCSLVIALDVH